MIKDGIALVRLASSPHGCGGSIDEFYAVVFEGHVLPVRFMSYAEAFKHSEKLWAEVRADVA